MTMKELFDFCLSFNNELKEYKILCEKICE